MAGIGEENRRRVAVAIFLIGCALILAGIALMILHRQNIQASQPPPLSPEGKVALAWVLKQTLFWVLILVGIFAVSSYAFLRWSRRFRKRLFRRPRHPTKADDVWSMHRLPDEPTTDQPSNNPEP